MSDLSQIHLNGTLTGTIATSANGSGTKFFRDTYVEYNEGSRVYKIKLSAFGKTVEGAESLMGQKVTVGARLGLNPSQDGSAVYSEITVNQILPGASEDGGTFVQTGYVSKIEKKSDKVISLTLQVSSEEWNNKTKTREELEKEINIAFFSDYHDQVEKIVRGQQVIVKGDLRSSGDKNYLDFIGRSVSVLGETVEVDTAGI